MLCYTAQTYDSKDGNKMLNYQFCERLAGEFLLQQRKLCLTVLRRNENQGDGQSFWVSDHEI